jgi:hypothetical protein
VAAADDCQAFFASIDGLSVRSAFASADPCGPPFDDEYDTMTISYDDGAAVAKNTDHCSGSPFFDVRAAAETLQKKYFTPAGDGGGAASDSQSD